MPPFASLRKLAASAKRELSVYRRVLADPRTPRSARLLLALAVGYVLMPFDLIPDWIPVIGLMDDLLLVPLLFWLALRFIPTELLEEHRRAVRDSQ